MAHAPAASPGSSLSNLEEDMTEPAQTELLERERRGKKA
jgi:hypothetical protein